MNIDQLNEFINKGGAAFALIVIAAILVFVVFRKEVEKNLRKR